jgi:hypothetical protein
MLDEKLAQFPVIRETAAAAVAKSGADLPDIACGDLGAA